MGNTKSFNKISFEDVQHVITGGTALLISTLSINEQACLITGTIHIQEEEKVINRLLSRGDSTKTIVVYGKHCNDETIHTKYSQLVSLGLPNVYLYVGGLFEWLLLQDTYGDDNFQTTSKELDHLKFRPRSLFLNCIEN